MAITVKHTKVSTIPDGDDTSVVRPSDWNADHQLVGTVPVANGGTGAATLTGYVKGNGTSAMTANTTIPNTDVTGQELRQLKMLELPMALQPQMVQAQYQLVNYQPQYQAH